MTEIRIASLEDAEIITNIQISAWRHSYTHVSSEILASLSIEKRTARWMNLIRKGEVQLYVLDTEAGIVGFCQIDAALGIDELQNCGELKKLYIHPSSHNHGFGSLLFKYGTNKLREQLFTDVVLWVAVENTNAIRFYKNRGFHDDGSRRIDTFTDDGYSVAYPSNDWDDSKTLKPAEALEARYRKKIKAVGDNR